MRLALKLAEKGRGRTSPNPMVGAVLVRRGRIIGRGYHRGPGSLHAEIEAVNRSGGRAAGSTLYTNLEPCAHTQKRTPPCAQALARAKISRLVVAMRDPNPSVRGRGLKLLARAGVRIREGVLAEEAVRLNESYCKYMTRRRPFVVMKIAQSLDGKIATASGASRWITSERAREYVHRLRAQADVVMIGVGTLLKDNPRLTARRRLSDGRQPIRLVVDSRLRTPPTARILREGPAGTAWIAATNGADRFRARRLEAKGARILQVKGCGRRVDLDELMRVLAEMQIMNVLIEGGSELNASALRDGVVDKVVLILAPRLIGGRDAVGSLGGVSPRRLSESLAIRNLKIRRLGPDVMLEGYV